jgi:hypothetical protein
VPVSGRMTNTAHYGGGVGGRGEDFGGMTVNERLFAAGLVEQFDAAIDSDNRQLAVDLLEQVAMARDSAAATVDAILAHPSRYGYPRGS